MRVKMIVAYDGTNYCGWQIQNNGLSVEEVMNRELSRLLNEEIKVIGASRTDSGVHSLGNVAVFDTQTRIPAEKLSFALNQRLPEDIRITDSCEVAADFHPRHCDSIKTYEYRILNAPFQIPQYRLYHYWTYVPMDVQLSGMYTLFTSSPSKALSSTRMSCAGRVNSAVSNAKN